MNSDKKKLIGIQDVMVELRDTTYENIIKTCSHCGKQNIFNRRSDLKRTNPIGHCVQACEQCSRDIHINGDRLNESFQSLYLDALPFLKMKNYMICIVNFSIAIEMFMYSSIMLKLVLDPLSIDMISDNTAQQITDAIEVKTNKLAYIGMRNIFFDLYINVTIESEKDIFNYLFKEFSNIKIIKKSKIKNLGERKEQLLKEFYDLDLNIIRNKVVHVGYRPTEEEASRYEEATNDVVFGLWEEIQ